MAIAKPQTPQVGMWDDMNTVYNTGAITGVIGAADSTITVASKTGLGSISTRTSVDEIFDRYSLNEFIVEHRVQEFELMKLRETNVDYADIIKENLAKTASKDLIKKMTFTKKHDMNNDTHSFRGRVWVFTKDELNKMIEEIRNGV